MTYLYTVQCANYTKVQGSFISQEYSEPAFEAFNYTGTGVIPQLSLRTRLIFCLNSALPSYQDGSDWSCYYYIFLLCKENVRND